MLILLPPSETKRSGGLGSPLDLERLALVALRPQRQAVIDALVALSADEGEAARVLKLSERQRGDIVANAVLRTAPTMPAVDRYTGVLYDALDAASLPGVARRWLATHVLIHSAPLGPVSALDPLPMYRLAAGTSLPGLPGLRRHWSAATTDALRASAPRFVLDLRSEAYTALGPVPTDTPHVYVRVVTKGPGGAVRALNHFNKRAKGELVRHFALTRPQIGSLDTLFRWAQASGVALRPGAPGECELVV